MAMSIFPEHEKILDKVLASGQFKNHHEALAEALRLLCESTNGTDAGSLPLAEWQTKFQKFVDSIPRTKATFVDLSRESIYEGRGA